MDVEQLKNSRKLYILEKGMDYSIVILLSLMIIFAFLQVLFRYALRLPYPWTEELARYLMIWLVFIGAAAGVRLENHIKIDILENAFPSWLLSKINIFTTFLAMLTCLAYLWVSINYIVFLWRSGDSSITLGISIAIPASSMVVGAFFMTFYFVLNLYKKIVGS